MITATPIYLGILGPFVPGDIVDRYVSLRLDELVAGESVTAATFALYSMTDVEVLNSVTAIALTSNVRVDFRLTVPAVAGMYWIKAVFTVNDGQRITKTARVDVS